MSITSHAAEEMKRANFSKESSEVMLSLLRQFLDEWDSRGAVAAMQPVFNKLLAGKNLTPLTDEDDEWMDVDGQGLFQNVRCSSVFKGPDGKAYDIDLPGKGRQVITFPYTPQNDRVGMPVFEI